MKTSKNQSKVIKPERAPNIYVIVPPDMHARSYAAVRLLGYKNMKAYITEKLNEAIDRAGLTRKEP